MCKELVSLNTQDVSKAIPVTNSFIISEKYGVSHKSVTNILRKYKKDFEEFGELEHFKNALENATRETMIFNLNEEQFYLLVTYMKNTEIARKYKIQFVKAFSFHKKELMFRINTRHLVKDNRKSLTDSIKNFVTDEGNFKKFAYSTYSKLVYKKVLGKDVKKSKEERGLKEKDNIRDFMTIEELEKVQELESKIATYIEFTDNSGKTDKEIYQDVKKYIEK